MKQIENLAPLFSFPMFLYWLIFWGFRKIASDVFFSVCIFFLVDTVGVHRSEHMRIHSPPSSGQVGMYLDVAHEFRCSLFLLVVSVKTFTGRLVDIYFLHAGRHHGHHPARAPGRGWALPDGWPRVRGRSADHLLSTRHARHGHIIGSPSGGASRIESGRAGEVYRTTGASDGSSRNRVTGWIECSAGLILIRKKDLQVTCARPRGVCDQQSLLL